MWNYSALVYYLGPDNEGWRQEHGELIYTDGTIGRVRVSDGPDGAHHIIEAAMHCIYISIPAVWFFPLVNAVAPTRGRFGSGIFDTVARPQPSSAQAQNPSPRASTKRAIEDDL